MNAVLEGAGVLLGLVYVLLAIRENRLCWLAGGGASLAFLKVFWDAGLPMQALLQVYYVGVAVHGWLHWGRPDTDAEAVVVRLAGRGRTLCLGLLLFATLATIALQPSAMSVSAVLDAGTSWGGVLATWLVARKILEAWLWWVAIDLATIALYLQADLLASSALYALYTGLAYLGWREWRRHYLARHETPGIAPV